MRLLRVARAGRWHVRRFAAAAVPKEPLTLSSLEDGVTIACRSEAVMWAKVHPFSPLHTGQLFNPF